MIVVRTIDTVVQEFEFEDEVGEQEALRIVEAREVPPVNEYNEWDIESWVE